MNYEFGDIIDCRKHPIKVERHFIVVFGVDGKQRVLYQTITSRIYKAFEKLCSFFNNHCIGDKCKDKHFDQHFKDKYRMKSENVFDVFFFDKKNYPLSLTEDCMIVIKSEPEIKDVQVFNKLRKDKSMNDADKLSNEDMQRLYTHLKTSKHISPYNLSQIGKSFNAVKRNRTR